ncbi:MAG: thiamine pyrophosphate-binding protein [Terriglobales bacterium]
MAAQGRQESEAGAGSGTQGGECLKGSQIVLDCLRAEGVDLVFGYPGGAIMPLYDAPDGAEGAVNVRKWQGSRHNRSDTCPGLSMPSPHSPLTRPQPPAIPL